MRLEPSLLLELRAKRCFSSGGAGKPGEPGTAPERENLSKSKVNVEESRKRNNLSGYMAQTPGLDLATPEAISPSSLSHMSQ